MATALKIMVALSVGGMALMGDPMRLSLVPTAAAAAQMICASTNYQYSYCRTGIGGAQVGIIEQLSRAPCIERRSWGYDSRGIWVSNGCAARFGFSSGHGGSDVAAAAIVGGLIGALLGGAVADQHPHRSDDYHYHDPYYRPYPVTIEHRTIVEHRRDTSQDVDPTVRKFDRDGNPNYDADGNYQGPHGVGALVDNPDAPRDDDGSNRNPDGSGGPN